MYQTPAWDWLSFRYISWIYGKFYIEYWLDLSLFLLLESNHVESQWGLGNSYFGSSYEMQELYVFSIFSYNSYISLGWMGVLCKIYWKSILYCLSTKHSSNRAIKNNIDFVFANDEINDAHKIFYICIQLTAEWYYCLLGVNGPWKARKIEDTQPYEIMTIR